MQLFLIFLNQPEKTVRNPPIYIMHDKDLRILLMSQFRYAVSVRHALLKCTLSYSDYLKGCRYYLPPSTQIAPSGVRLITFRL